MHRHSPEREREVLQQARPKNMNKHLRRRLEHHVHVIGVTFNQEEGKHDSPEIKEILYLQQKPQTKRRWSVLEVFTWTCAISLAASARQWTL